MNTLHLHSVIDYWFQANADRPDALLKRVGDVFYRAHAREAAQLEWIEVHPKYVPEPDFSAQSDEEAIARIFRSI